MQLSLGKKPPHNFSFYTKNSRFVVRKIPIKVSLYRTYVIALSVSLSLIFVSGIISTCYVYTLCASRGRPQNGGGNSLNQSMANFACKTENILGVSAANSEPTINKANQIYFY